LAKTETKHAPEHPDPKKPAVDQTGAVVLALIITAVCCWRHAPAAQSGGWVLPLSFEDQIEREGRENKAYLAANQAKLERIAVYLEDYNGQVWHPPGSALAAQSGPGRQDQRRGHPPGSAGYPDRGYRQDVC
jgi:hypothetical protein